MRCMEIVTLLPLGASLLFLLCALPSTTAAGNAGRRTALLIIDVQDCFLPPTGSLAVTDGDQVIPKINQIRQDWGDMFSLVVLSQDWHCPDHVSFASQHAGFAEFSLINLTYNSNGELCRDDTVSPNFPYNVNCSGGVTSEHVQVTQTLWPDHCIKNVTSGSTSAEFSTSLRREETDIVVRKGYSCEVDSYSAFYDNGGFRQTELHSILQQHNIHRVVVTGLALDYCVYYTSKDAHTLGYEVITVTDAARGVANDTTVAALQDLETIGVTLLTTAQLQGTLEDTSGAPQNPSSSFARLAVMVMVGSLVTLTNGYN